MNIKLSILVAGLVGMPAAAMNNNGGNVQPAVQQSRGNTVIYVAQPTPRHNGPVRLIREDKPNDGRS